MNCYAIHVGEREGDEKKVLYEKFCLFISNLKCEKKRKRNEKRNEKQAHIGK